MMADMFSREKLTRAVGIFTTGAMMGTGFAFLFGGRLLGVLGGRSVITLPLFGPTRLWQVAFLAAGTPGIILALLMLTVREPKRPPISDTNSPTWAAVWAFLRVRWTVLLLHFTGFSCLTMMLYGFMTWVPALFIRIYGMSPTIIGVAIGAALAVFGIAGLIAGAAMADRWTRLGQADAHMRVGLVGMTVALPFALLLSLGTNVTLGVVSMSGLFFGLLLPSAAGPAGLQLITPALLRGRISSLFMVVINLIGLGIGPLGVALFTDHLFRNKLAVGRSLGSMTLLVMPLGIAVFALTRRPFAAAVQEQRLAFELTAYDPTPDYNAKSA